MSKKKRGLGRGLDALLGDTAPVVAAPTSGETVAELPLEELQPGRFQPRTEMDAEALGELADSIKAQGVVQPIVVRPLDAGGYEIVAGERRWRAAGMAGLATIPALVRELPDQTVLAVGLIENIQRENLNALDEAMALHRLIEECGLTHEQCATAVGRSRASVSNLLRLLNLANEVQDHVRAGRLGMGHARALLALPVELQAEAAQRVVTQDLSARETEALVRRMNAPPAPPQPPRPALDDRWLLQRDKLAEKLKARVQIATSDDGKGRLVIHYRSDAELDSIFQRLG